MDLAERVRSIFLELRDLEQLESDMSSNSSARASERYIASALDIETHVKEALKQAPCSIVLQMGIVDLYRDIGNAYLNRRALGEAEAYFRQALSTVESIGFDVKMLAAEASMPAFLPYAVTITNMPFMRGRLLLAEGISAKGLGRVLNQKGMAEDAQANLQRAKKAYQAVLSGMGDVNSAGFAMINLGNIFLEAGEYEEAKGLYQNALNKFPFGSQFHGAAVRELLYLNHLKSQRS